MPIKFTHVQYRYNNLTSEKSVSSRMLNYAGSAERDHIYIYMYVYIYISTDAHKPCTLLYNSGGELALREPKELSCQILRNERMNE